MTTKVKAQRHYYARMSPRGFGNEIVIHRFVSRESRDRWIASQGEVRLDNNLRPITRREAIKLLRLPDVDRDPGGKLYWHIGTCDHEHDDDDDDWDYDYAGWDLE